MGTKVDFSERVKIWELFYIQGVKIDPIRSKVSEGDRNGVAPAWATVDRVVKMFPDLTQAQVQELPKALQMRWRELQGLEELTEPAVLERTEAHQLIQKWRIEVESYSPIQLLQRWLNEVSQDALGRFFTDEGTKMAYQEAKRRHFETFDPERLHLQVESDPIFGLLRQ